MDIADKSDDGEKSFSGGFHLICVDGQKPLHPNCYEIQ